MKTLKVSLARINSHDLKETDTNPFWYATDCSIRLSHNDNKSIEVSMDNLSERTLLELKAAQKLGLIKIKKVRN